MSSSCKTDVIADAITTRFVPIRKRGGVVGGHAAVSVQDFDYASQFKWSRHTAGYAYRKDAGRTVLLHREVAERAFGAAGDEVDHINRLRCDNRRSNLRSIDRRRGAQNMTAKGASGYRGVDYRPNQRGSKKWRARERGNLVGYFAKPEEAAKAASDARRKTMPYSTED